MIEIEFEKIHESYSSSEMIKNLLLADNDVMKFSIRIASARHYSDLAHDCLEAAFIGQQLTSFAVRIAMDKKPGEFYDTIVEFELKPIDYLALGNLIFNYGQIYSGDSGDDGLDFIESLSEYREDLDNIKHSFPELVDDYYANYINGEYYEYDWVEQAEFFAEEFKRYPERKHGFSKSAYSNVIDQIFYASIDSIIVPANSNLDLILKEYSGIENIAFTQAEFFAIGNITYLISNGFIIHFPFDSLMKAKQCAWTALEPKDDIYEEEGSWMFGLLSFDRARAKYSPKENMRGYPEDQSEKLLSFNSVEGNDIIASPSVVSFYISSYGDHLLVKDSKYSYFFFGTDKLTLKELGFLGNRLSVLFNTTANLAGIHVEIKCPWGQLNDETFEELCYDIIYHNPNFDNNTIRKMGKSRSRDGGRDIVVFTHARPGKTTSKFIFQCKYQKPGSSLTGSKLQDISDTVTQYGARGYGILTNVVIDSTLYDKMDGIALNLKVDIEDYSVYKLERILAGYPQIKKRHFNLDEIH